MNLSEQEETKKIQHVFDCKELMTELCNKVSLFVDINEYTYGRDFHKAVDINIRDKERYLVYRATDVVEVIGFIKGIQYAKTVQN